MAVQIRIGPTADASRFRSAALPVWNRFVLRLGRPLPVDVTSVRATQFDQNCDAQAVAMLRLRRRPRPDIGDILLSERFFTNCEEQQFSTLLHEVVHFALLAGPFRERYAAADALDQRESARVAGRGDCSDQRYRLAFQFRNIADEVAAEWFVNREYPEHADLRLAHYLEMRRGNLQRPVPAPVSRRTGTGAIELVRRLSDHSDEDLVAELNTAGFKTGTNRAFDIAAVRWVRFAHQIPSTPRRAPGELTVAVVAVRLGTSDSAIYYWIEQGQLAARRDHGGRLYVPFPSSVEEACRQRVRASVHMKPRTQTCAVGGAV